MLIVPGMRLAQYEVAAAIGHGGMGAVYRARDTKLGRDVAVKVLPDEFTEDKERLARFDREARVLASLNHPHIASIHDFAEHDGAKFLVMELVEGETLEARMRGGPVPIDEAVQIAGQIANALDAAHEKGIVHRDLKPANVMLTEHGSVKILDFGLARTDGGSGGESDVSHSPTVARLATHAGMILGTAAYMSPEQARGKRVDRRSDIWSFGVILWEMLTGRRLFDGETVSDTLASVLTRDVDFSALPSVTPRNVEWVLRRCLSRDPRRRLHDAGDVWLALQPDEMFAEQRSAAVTPPRRQRLLMAAAVLLAASTIALAVALSRSPRPEPAQPLHVSVPLPPGVRLALTGIQPAPPVISPDGRRIVLGLDETGKKRRLWVRDIGSGEGRWLEGTDNASYPFWSFDGQHIGFFADDKLKRIPVAGGTPLTIANAPNAKGGTWNADDVILFAPVFNSPLYRVAASGGPPTQVTKVNVAGGDSSHRFPQFLAGGKRFIYFVRKRGETGHRMVTSSLDGGTEKTILEVDQHAFAAGGYLFFRREGSLWAQAFDPDRGELAGVPAPVASDVKVIPGANRLIADASPEVLLLLSGELRNAAQLHWVDRSGQPLGELGEAADYLDRTLSPDGSRVAARIGYDVWVIDAASGNRERLTFDGSARSQLVWSPDGRRIGYTSIAGGPPQILAETIPASGKPEILVPAVDGNLFPRPSSWSPDGNVLLYEVEDRTRNQTAIMMFDLTKRSSVPVTEVPTRFPDATFSPDGRWIAFGSSNAQGRPAIYVAAYPEVRRRWEVAEGESPFWGRDPKELFFQDSAGYVHAVTVKATAETFAWGQPARLFQIYTTPMTRDGQRFLVSYDVGEGRSEPIELIVNWRATLRPTRGR